MSGLVSLFLLLLPSGRSPRRHHLVMSHPQVRQPNLLWFIMMLLVLLGSHFQRQVVARCAFTCCGNPKYTPFWWSALCYRAPPKTFFSTSKMETDILQNLNWRPPICSLCIESHRKLASPIHILGGINLHFGGRNCLWGAAL